MTEPMTKSAFRALHDQLVAERPELSKHDPDNCALCGMTDDEPAGGNVGTHTDDELKAAVDSAVAEATGALQTRIKELEASQQVSEVESAKAELRAELQEQVDDLQRQLDEKVLEASTAQQELEALKTWLEDAKVAAEEAETMAARRDERLEKVREVAAFPDEYLEANADRFAAMSDEDFEVALEGWRQIASKGNGSRPAPAPRAPRTPAATALHASRDDEGSKSDMRDVLAMRIRRIDPATL